jgi:hypothetical protein
MNCPAAGVGLLSRTGQLAAVGIVVAHQVATEFTWRWLSGAEGPTLA